MGRATRHREVLVLVLLVALMVIPPLAHLLMRARDHGAVGLKRRVGRWTNWVVAGIVGAGEVRHHEGRRLVERDLAAGVIDDGGARIIDSDDPQTVAIEDEPFDSVISETTRIV